MYTYTHIYVCVYNWITLLYKTYTALWMNYSWSILQLKKILNKVLQIKTNKQKYVE